MSNNGGLEQETNEVTKQFSTGNTIDFDLDTGTDIDESELSTSSPRNSIFQSVILLIDDNINHFACDDSEQGQRIFSGLIALKDGVLKVGELSEILRKASSSYDFSPSVPGNGFRSFSNLSQQAILSVFELCKKLSGKRGSLLLFRKGHYVKEVEAWGQTMASIRTILDYSTTVLLSRCENGNLMPPADYSLEELFSLMNTVSQYSLYGRCLGFHYCEALQKTMRVLNIGMCAFSEVYYSDGGFLQRTKQSVFTGSKYLLDPELRARRIVDVIQYSSVDFIKSFWSLADTELLTQLPSIVGPTLSVQQMILVSCEESEILSLDNKILQIPPPSSHLPPSPIPCHLLSAVMREGMPGERTWKGAVLPATDSIVFHCHGGGFVTQSTKAQEVFLRDWAVSLRVPILSVDYSLAPKAKYPRPLEEVLTAYIWMLNNFKLLGTTGVKIIFTGDSAGGNLLTALTIKCLELNIRAPDGLFLAYVPFDLKVQPTPSRILGLMDPMLPLSFALRCLKAYTGLPIKGATPATSPSTDDSLDSITSSSNLETSPEHSSKSISKKKKENKSKNSETLCEEEVNTTSVAVTAVVSDDLVGPSTQMSRSVSEDQSDTMTTVSLTSDPTSRCDDPKGESGKNVLIDSEMESKEDRSRKYVTEFLDKYVLDSKTDKQGKKVPIVRSTGSEEDELIDDENHQNNSDNNPNTFGAKFEKAKTSVISSFRLTSSKLGKSKKDDSATRKNDKNSDATRKNDKNSDATRKNNKNSDATRKNDKKEELDDESTTFSAKISRTPSFGNIRLGTTKLRRDSSCTLMEDFVGIEFVNDHYLSPLTAPRQTLARFPTTSIFTVEYDFCLDDCVTMAKLLRSLGVTVTLDVLDKLPHGFLSLNLVSKESHEGCKMAVARLRQLLELEKDDNL